MCFLSDLAVSVITCTLERLWNPVERQICYVIQYGSNLRNLRKQVTTLEANRDDVQEMVKVAEDKGEKIKAEVLDWQANVIQIELNAETWEDEIKKNSGCCHAWHLDWRSRHRLSRRAKKMAVDIDDVLAPEKKFERVSFPAPTPSVEAIPTPDFIPLESSMVVMNQIMETLKDETNNISIIGVYGAGGIGKTTLIKQVVKQAEEGNLFDKVVIATVSQTPNLEIIQDRIAEFFGFKIEEEGEYLRRARLSERLKRNSKVLIVLDDLWKRLELGNVGIPYGNEHRGCKIIVTSRFVEVCDEMETERYFHVEELSEQDALNLFKMKAGIPGSHALDRAAKEVIKQCGRLPNSIVTVGRALRNKPLDKWNGAIQKVKKSTSINIEGIPEEVVLSLTLGYEQLESDEANLCLLFCCLFPAYYSVSMEELVIYGLVDRLFPNVGTLEEVWNRMQSVIDYLKSSNLLLVGDREYCFTVHDDTRKVVELIASQRGYNLVAKASLRLTGWPAEGWGSCKRMSLMDNDIAKLPGGPECRQLITLFLQNNPLEEIPEKFFQQMRALRYLDLSYTNISSLPLSVQCLEGLRSLRLENTHLRDAALLNGLKELEVLILRGSCVEFLPERLEEMVNLKLLDLSNNLYLKCIPFNVISKLSQVEELYIGNSFGEWEFEGTGNQCNASFSEVASLASLTVLHIHVKNTESLSIDFAGPWGNLKKFRVCVNDDYWDISYARSMHLKNLSYPVADWVKLLLKRTEHLALARSRDLEDIVQKDVQGLNDLKSLHLRACSVDYIFRSSSFPKVENLEELQVEYCYSVKEVFYLEEIEEEHAKLTRLRELILVGLPKMTTIWKGNLSIAHLDNLKLMKVKECGKLRSLFSEALAQKVHQLEHLAIVKCDNMEEIISNEHVEVEQEAAHIGNISNMPSPMFFKNLQKLIISKCKKMKSVLPLRLVQGLEKLEELAIASCEQMDEITSTGEEEEEAKDQNMLPRLKILALQNLPKLGTLYKGELLLSWPSLQELQVWNCPNLKKLHFGLHSAPKLRKFKGQAAWFGNLEWEAEFMITKTRLQSLLTEED